jgi:hypothetical protein
MFHANPKSSREDVTSAEAARPAFVECPSGSPVIGVPASGWKPGSNSAPAPTRAAEPVDGYYPVTNSKPRPVPSVIGLRSPSYLDKPPRPVHTRISMVAGIAPEVALYAPEVRKPEPKPAPKETGTPATAVTVSEPVLTPAAPTPADGEPVLVELTADTSATGPYAAGADWYRSRGWEGILPLPPGKKTWPPAGYTGKGGAMPTGEQIEAWKVSKGTGNIALRLPARVISIDVDGGYVKDGKLKVGEVQLAKLEAELGETLPPTWIATSRAPELSPLVSGKRFYRLPDDYTGELRDLTGDLDLLHFGYRYAAVWPSTNPDNGGAVNRWYCQVPGLEFTPDELPVIGPKWLAYITSTAARSSGSKPGKATSTDGAANPDDQWIVDACLTPGEPSAPLRAATAKKCELLAVAGSRHKNALPAVNWALGAGAEGNPGAAWAVAELRHAFVSNDPGGEGEVSRAAEFNKFLEPTPALIDMLRNAAAKAGRIIGETVGDGIIATPNTSRSDDDDAWFKSLTEPVDCDAGNGGTEPPMTALQKLHQRETVGKLLHTDEVKTSSDDDVDEDDDKYNQNDKAPNPLQRKWIRTLKQADDAGWARIVPMGKVGKVYAWHDKNVYPLGHPYAPDLVEAIFSFSDCSRYWLHMCRNHKYPVGPVPTYYEHLMRLGVRLPVEVNIDGRARSLQIYRYGQSGDGKSEARKLAHGLKIPAPAWWSELNTPAGPPDQWAPPPIGDFFLPPEPMWDAHRALGSGEVLKHLLTELDKDGKRVWKKHPVVRVEEAESEAFFARISKGGSTIMADLNKTWAAEKPGTDTITSGFDDLPDEPFEVYVGAAIQDTIWPKLTGQLSGGVQRAIPCSSDDLWRTRGTSGVALPPVGYIPSGIPDHLITRRDQLGRRQGFTFCDAVDAELEIQKANSGLVYTEEVDARKTHALQNRLRIAAHVALSIGTLHVDERTWEHSGLLMEHSARVVAMADAAAERVLDREDIREGGRRHVIRSGEKATAEDKHNKARNAIVDALKDNGEMKKEDCRGAIPSPLRGEFVAAVTSLLDVVAVEKRGRSTFLRLK